jgi:uncharacterized protein
MKDAPGTIIDLCAHLGPWSSRPVGLDVSALAALLAPIGVARTYAGRLEALWYENPHDANRVTDRPLTNAAVDVRIVPVLDPTVATWPDELERLTKLGSLVMVRLYPAYGSYTLADADGLLAALARRKIIAQVMVRMEDVRRQNPLAQVPDVPVPSVVDAAERHPDLTVLLSGANTPELRAAASRLPKANNLWAETSRLDGNGALPRLMQSPWRDRLVFGTHAPLFIPYSAAARVVLDLDDDAASRVLSTNPAQLLGDGK